MSQEEEGQGEGEGEVQEGAESEVGVELLERRNKMQPLTLQFPLTVALSLLTVLEVSRSADPWVCLIVYAPSF